MKQVKFDIELVKKIQAGEIKGSILTRDGRPARFLGEIKDSVYPLVFAREIEHIDAAERIDIYTLTGKYNHPLDEHEKDIILEIEDEQKESEYQFKPFDKVLVRDADIQKWRCALFSHNTNDKHGFVASALYWEQCIPYEGNQDLVGTTKTPKDYGGK